MRTLTRVITTYAVVKISTYVTTLETNQKGEMQLSVGNHSKEGDTEKEKDIKRREKDGMRKSGSRRKVEPSRRYIGIGVSHYKGVFHRIFKYSYSLPSGAIGVGGGRVHDRGS